ncbi:DUF3558 domain-containing protein [Actinomadura kijaniata]|uniref:DUF3558 domain-containing protein n=1 Tax=Actinomadura kijaniata TaxID=46161 RepID=UPI000833935B|nr:DUF3558 domain-containing protein [Actinomadura kijaniata]
MSQPPLPPWTPQPATFPRMARLFDSVPPGGRPVVQRPPVPLHERDALLTYLKQAPVVLSARGFDEDLMDPSRPAEVPMTFHTDGIWVWPGSAVYYLRVHNVPPDPELLAHIRARGFRVPPVPEEAREAAVRVATGQAEEPAPAPPPLPAPEPPGPGADPPPAPPAPSRKRGRRAIAGCLAVVLVVGLFLGFRGLRTVLKKGLDDDGRPAGNSAPYTPPSPAATPGTSPPADARRAVVTSLPPLCGVVKRVLPAKARGTRMEPNPADGADRRFCRWRALNARFARNLEVSVDAHGRGPAKADGPARAAAEHRRDRARAATPGIYAGRAAVPGLGDEAYSAAHAVTIHRGPDPRTAIAFRTRGAEVGVREGNVTVRVIWSLADGYQRGGRVLDGTYPRYSVARAEALAVARAVLARLG